MPSTYADCPVCGFECQVDDDLPEQPIECPKCKKSFTVEVGESYGVDGAPPVRSSSAASDAEEPEEPEEAEGQEGKSWLEAWPKD